MRGMGAGDALGVAGDDDWVARKENEAGNRRGGPRMSLEDEPVAGNQASFEELLARELEKTNDYALPSEGWTSTSGRTIASASSVRSAATASTKKPFLKKGARGWWMQRPDAKTKMQKHTLVSKEEEAAAAPARARPEKKAAVSIRRKPAAQKSVPPPPASSRSPEPFDRPPVTICPPASPIQRQHDYGRHDVVQKTDSPAAPMDWKDASFASNATMGMSRVRLSYEAKREREADELAEFEAIERELAAERNGYLKEKEEAEEHKQHGSAHVWHGYSHGESTRWHTRQYSSSTSSHSPAQNRESLHQETRAEPSTTPPVLDDRLDLEARSDFIFDGKQSSVFLHDNDEWRRYSTEDSMDFNHRLSDPLFGRGNHAPSELSAISFDDSVPWDDGLSLQPQDARETSPRDPLRSPRPRGSSGSAASLLGEARVQVPGSAYNGYGSFDEPSMSALQSQRTSRPRDLASGYRFDTVHEDPELSGEFNEDGEDQAPVSSLVQQVFGGARADEDSFSIESHYEEMFDPDDAVDQGRGPTGGNSAPRQDTGKAGLSSLHRKMNGKPKPATASADRRRPGANDISSKGARSRTGIPPRSSANKPRIPATGPKTSNYSSRSNPSGTAGPILPTVIEEKLYELEEEVKFYRAETLQLQKRKEHYDQEARKLLKEREEFARYQQEQQALMEKEWQQERAKMKKESQLMDRQWKLRMNATSSTQDRKAKGEIEVLKAQIVKMQVDEAARMTKWKNSNENLRQRIAELEVKNQELSEEVKFLENDRLVQWEKFERQLKEKQDQLDRLTSTSGFGDAETRRNPFERDDPIWTTGDLFSIRNAADELLTSWSRDQPQSERDAGAQYSEKAQPMPPSSSSQALGTAGLVNTAASASSGAHRRAHSSTDGYNPKRYSLEKAASEPSASMTNLSSDVQANAGKKQFASSTRSDGARGNFGALHRSDATGSHDPSDPAQHNANGRLDDDDRTRDQGRPPRSSPSSSPSISQQSTTKQVAREISHAGGKKEVVFTDGSKRIVFPDGNEKEIEVDGHTLIKFTNGDRKEVFPDTGISIYYYYEAQTKLTTYPDQTKVYEFPNQQIEKSFPDGSTEIVFADGITKTIRVNDDEFSVFPDGTTMLERKDGLREVALLNGKKIRYYPDGRMACVATNGEETEVRSDAELRRLMER